MHIPDGFLDTKTWVLMSAVSAGALGVAVQRTRDSAMEARIPLMGVTAAFVFAAQMVNFPVAGGTSGHFMGAVLVAVLLGPFSGLLVMATLLAVQCLFFQDGGITALGANIFNMGILGPWAGYGVYRLLAKACSRPVRAAVAGWFSVVIAASACAVELAVSGTVPLKAVLPAMAGVHAVIGIAEGVITAAILGTVGRVRPDLLELDHV